MKRIEVAAAVIRKGDMIFATQRGYGDFKDWWEFPGGTVEPGETPEEISIDRYLKTVEWDYPAFHITLHCYLCYPETDDLHLNEHEAACWLDAASIHSVRWLPADEALLPLIAEELKNEAR